MDTAIAYGGPNHSGGNANNYGRPNDPMIGEFIGGVNVFGGGLAMYNGGGQLVGAVGVSGDTSCADHNIAWRVRNTLGLDFVPVGVSDDSDRPDNINYIGQTTTALEAEFSHPICTVNGADNVSTISAALPAVPQ